MLRRRAIDIGEIPVLQYCCEIRYALIFGDAHDWNALEVQVYTV